MVPEMGRARARVKAIVFKIIGLVLRRSSAHLAASLAHTLLPVTSRRSPTFAAVEYAPVHPMTVHVRHVADGLTEAEDMCIDSTAVATVTRVLTYSAKPSDCTAT